MFHHTPQSPVPFYCSLQLGGGYGTSCYREWGSVANALLGKGYGGIRRALNVWARTNYGVWFLRNPDEGDCAVFEIHSETGFQEPRGMFGSSEGVVYEMLLLKVLLTHSGEVYGYEVVPTGERS